jgi:hypothetical protein
MVVHNWRQTKAHPIEGLQQMVREQRGYSALSANLPDTNDLVARLNDIYEMA